jgi:two-component system response regulator
MQFEQEELGEQETATRRILVVEDDRSHRWVVRRVLENSFGEEVQVEEASSGEEGLARARRRPPVELILLDLNLPDMSGFEVLRRLRAEPKTRSVPVVVLSSSQENDDVRRAYECGANSYVSKSQNPEQMIRQLRLLPVYWLDLNRLPTTEG